MKSAVVGSSLLLFILACSDRNTPEHVAEDFVYNYYLHANQQMALRLSDGLAKQKLEDEIELLRKIRSGSEMSKAQPHIKYKQVGKKSDDENQVVFRYELTIEDTNISDTVRNAVILTESIDGQWKVINFDEYGQ